MKKPGNTHLKGNLMLLLTAMIWGAGFVAQSAGMAYIGPFTMQTCRFFLSGLVLLPLILVRDIRGKSDKKPVTSKEKRQLLLSGAICGLLLCVASSFQQFGILHTSVGKSGFITALYILLVPLFGLFLHQKVSRNIWFAVALSLGGLYFLCLSGGASSINLGDLLTLICSVFFALHILYIDHVGSRVDCVRMSCIQFFVNAGISAVCMFLFETPTLNAIFSGWLPICYAGILSGGVAYTLQIIGQQYTSPTLASMLLSLESVFAALFGALLIPDQALSGRELLGSVLMFAAIVLAQLPSRKKASSIE